MIIKKFKILINFFNKVKKINNKDNKIFNNNNQKNINKNKKNLFVYYRLIQDQMKFKKYK